MLYCELSPINQYDKDASYLVNYWGTEAHLKSLYTGYIGACVHVHVHDKCGSRKCTCIPEEGRGQGIILFSRKGQRLFSVTLPNEFEEVWIVRGCMSSIRNIHPSGSRSNMYIHVHAIIDNVFNIIQNENVYAKVIFKLKHQV